MSRMIRAVDGYVGIFAGGVVGMDRELVIGLQIEDERGSKTLTRVRLTRVQAAELAIELVSRAFRAADGADVEDLATLIRSGATR